MVSRLRAYKLCASIGLRDGRIASPAGVSPNPLVFGPSTHVGPLLLIPVVGRLGFNNRIEVNVRTLGRYDWNCLCFPHASLVQAWSGTAKQVSTVPTSHNDLRMLPRSRVSALLGGQGRVDLGTSSPLSRLTGRNLGFCVRGQRVLDERKEISYDVEL